MPLIIVKGIHSWHLSAWQAAQLRVTVSLKFNISVATCDQAACSAGGMFSSRGDSPLAR